MQIIFSLNNFTAVYSSYRHLFHNKKSTTIFIKLKVRWEEMGKHIQELCSPINAHYRHPRETDDRDTPFPASGALQP